MSGKWDKWYYYKLESPRPTGVDSSESSPLDIFVPIAGIGLLAAIGVIGWQIYIYLKVGEWPSLSIVSALHWCNVEWAHAPTDWVGVHRILSTIPLSLASFVAGMVPISLWLLWTERSGAK